MLLTPTPARSPFFAHLVVAIAAAILLIPGITNAQPWKVAPEKISRGPDLVGQQELSAAHDPTFDSVAGHFPMLAAPREALGVLESAREFIVTRYGEIELNNLQMDKPGQGEAYPGVRPENKATLYFLFGKNTPKTRYGEGNTPDSKRLVDGYLPMVIVPFTFQEVQYRQTIFAWSQGMDPDGRLWAYVGLEMKNPSAAAVPVELAYQAVCGLPGRVVPLDHWDLQLAPGETRRICLRIPRDGIVPDKDVTKDSPEFKKRGRSAQLPFCGGFQGVETVEPAEFDRRFDEVAQTWRTRLNRGMTIRVPEPRVNDAYRAWLAYLFTNVDKEGDRYLPHDGSGFYELVWGIAAIQACRAMDLYGYPEEAERSLDSICSLVQPDGELKTFFGLSDSGTLLVALEDHYRYTCDKEWLARVAPTIVKVCDWTIARRAREKEGQDPDSPTWGLIKYRPSGDYPEPDYSFLSDAAVCVGLEAAARLLPIVGRQEDARRIGEEAAAYRRDVNQAMTRSVFEHEGTELLPILPASRGWLLKADYGSTGYYSLFAALLLDTEFLAPDDPHAVLLTDALEKRGGLIAGVCTFYHLIDHAFTYGYWLEMLKRNQPKKAILALYASLAYGMSRTTYSGVECTDIHSGANQSTLPHLRSGTQQLRLLRFMLVREDGDSLLLAQAAPQHWFQPGQRVEVLDAPTYFGETSYTIESAVNEGRITARLVTPHHSRPREIQFFVRHPEGKPIRKVLADGKPVSSFDAGSVTLDEFGEAVTLEFYYQ
ncbi:MAG: hypothetical protein GXX96_03645 [Planctomycetaceae bacterium]|nr:hypothetical protein [Planctomycetaceae bacterium]